MCRYIDTLSVEEIKDYLDTVIKVYGKEGKNTPILAFDYENNQAYEIITGARYYYDGVEAYPQPHIVLKLRKLLEKVKVKYIKEEGEE